MQLAQNITNVSMETFPGGSIAARYSTILTEVPKQLITA